MKSTLVSILFNRLSRRWWMILVGAMILVSAAVDPPLESRSPRSRPASNNSGRHELDSVDRFFIRVAWGDEADGHTTSLAESRVFVRRVDDWRRTRDGWERMRDWKTERVSPRPYRWHPLGLTSFLLIGSIGALWAFSKD